MKEIINDEIIQNKKISELSNKENIIDINDIGVFQNIEIDDLLANLKEENYYNLDTNNNNTYQEMVQINRFDEDMQNINISESINIYQNNNDNNSNYQSLFDADSKIIPSEKESRRKSSMNLDSLKDDDFLLKRKSLLVEKNEFLKVEDWEFTKNLEENEIFFKNIEKQSNIKF